MAETQHIVGKLASSGGDYHVSDARASGRMGEEIPVRNTLPPRRESETFNFEHAGVRYTATVSRFPNGDLAEMFLHGGKPGSPADAGARDAAVLFSIARQYGVPAVELDRAMAKLEDGSPAGPVGVALELAGDRT